MSQKPVPTVVHPAFGARNPRKRPLPITLYDINDNPIDLSGVSGGGSGIETVPDQETLDSYGTPTAGTHPIYLVVAEGTLKWWNGTAWAQLTSSASSGSGIATVANQAALDALGTPPDGTYPIYLVISEGALKWWNGTAWAALASGSSGGGGDTGGGGVTWSLAANAAGLPASPVDGQLAVIRMGSGVDQFDKRLVYNQARAKWVEPGEGFQWIASLDQAGTGNLGADPTVKTYEPQGISPAYGWDFATIHRAATIFAAGLRMEYRQSCTVRGKNGKGFNIGTYFYNFASGEVTGTGADQELFTNPPHGGAAETDYLHVDGSGDFKFIQQGWTPLQAIGGGVPNPTKEMLYPAIYAFSDAGAVHADEGSFINYQLFVRCVA